MLVDTRSTICTYLCTVHSAMYLLLLLCLRYVQIVHSTCPTQLSLRSPSSPIIGDPNGPLLCCPAGLNISSTWARTRAGGDYFFGPRVHSVKILVNIYPRPPVASYSNPKVSISSSPAFLYCIICTCICFMLFRSTCSWPFSVENPLRVATEALNIHLVHVLFLDGI